MDLYKQELMDHYRYPKNKKILTNYNISFELQNPSCGDSVSIKGLIENSILCDISFDGSGCVISQAASSMVTEYVKNLHISNILKLNSDNIKKIIGMDLGPVRLKCALMSLQAIQNAIVAHYQAE